jgi:predicted MFS family arabinose efflux permease
MMALATASFFASATPVSFAWFFLWRFAAGCAGGTLMVLAAPTVLPHVPPARRGRAGGLIFTGVGLGIAASGTLVPLLLEAGLGTTWLGLGVLSLALTAFAWTGWPDAPAPSRPAAPQEAMRHGALLALYIAYALGAVGLVPHMVFLVDFVARGLGAGIAAGALQWVLFGMGALAGPLLAGALADRIGFAAAFRLSLLVEAGAVSLALLPVPGALALSSILVGAFVPGMVPLALGRVTELLPGDPTAQGAAWSRATIAFAIGQTVAAYGFSFLFARGGVYGWLFGLGSVALVIASATECAGSLRPGSAALSRRRW